MFTPKIALLLLFPGLKGAATAGAPLLGQPAPHAVCTEAPARRPAAEGRGACPGSPFWSRGQWTDPLRRFIAPGRRPTTAGANVRSASGCRAPRWRRRDKIKRGGRLYGSPASSTTCSRTVASRREWSPATANDTTLVNTNGTACRRGIQHKCSAGRRCRAGAREWSRPGHAAAARPRRVSESAQFYWCVHM